MSLKKKGYLFACSVAVSIFLFGDENLGGAYHSNDNTKTSTDLKHYYCTPSDARHFHLLKNLIGSIHHVDFDNLGTIAVFDLGMEPGQLDELRTMQKVQVYDVEMTNPHLLTYFLTAPSGRQVRGYFAWKPVIMKQALELFPHVLYLDAGTTILKPMNDIFQYIREQGYFLITCPHDPFYNIANRITKKVLENIVYTFEPALQDKILGDCTPELDAGLQGISSCPVIREYLSTMYEHSKDLSLFEDDGSAKYGYGAGRHDQILFSIYANTLSLTMHLEGWITLPLSNGTKQIHIHWDPAQIGEGSYIYRSRHDIQFQGGKTRYIRYVKN